MFATCLHPQLLVFQQLFHDGFSSGSIRVALVVACDLEGSIEGSSGGVVQQSIAHQVQDVLHLMIAVVQTSMNG